MAPVAVTENSNGTSNGLKSNGTKAAAEKVFNPFYSPPAPEGDDKGYTYAHYKVCSVHCTD